ncbi:zinc ribbon domain-containing protein [Candidatus Dependentiae bacterium]
MNSQAFQALIELVDFDQKTVSLKKDIKKVQEEIAVFEKQKTDLEQDMKQAKVLLHDTQKEVDLGELEMKEYEQQIKEKKERLDKASNQKEYASYQKEIEKLENKQHESEDPLIDAWNRLELAKQEYAKKEEAFEKKMSETLGLIEVDNKKVEDIKKELQEHNTHRDEKLKSVPQEWLEKYEILGARVSDPVVSVEGNSCGACFYNVVPQQMLEVKKGRLVQCKGCYRFLYVKKQEE